ncbi:MAG: hypothetical protein DWQ30_05675 [Acidobacteria bacterium]|nr:MAG: hypothetical protein DWQ30_05675 [Acidobacteriota bacterium]
MYVSRNQHLRHPQRHPQRRARRPGPAPSLLALTAAALLTTSPAAARVIGYVLAGDVGPQLFRVDLGSGEAEPVGEVRTRQLSGLAFDLESRLWSVDPISFEIGELDPTSGEVLAARGFDQSLQLTAPDLTFDPCGRLYLLDRPDPIDRASQVFEVFADGSIRALGEPNRTLQSIASTDGRLVALASDGEGTSSLVEVDRATGLTYGARDFQEAIPKAWIGFDASGNLWGVDPAVPLGPPLPPQAWIAGPILARRTTTTQFAANLNDLMGMAITPPGGACSTLCDEGRTTHCLQGGRFAVEVAYVADGAAEEAVTVLRRGDEEDSGLFTFFDPDNWEVMAKVLDGCSINGHYWVFLAAATDLEHLVTVTEASTGLERTYQRPSGPSLAENDTLAFACSASP